MRRLLGTMLAVGALMAATVPVLAAPAGSSPRDLRLTRAHGGVAGPITGAAAQALRSGPLPADRAALDRAKAAGSDRRGTSRAAPAAPSPSPSILLKKNGLQHPGNTPSDSTGAIGTTRYIETVNSRVGIYDRNLNLIKQDTLENWWDEPGADVFDPQVIWDATTSRFYYAGDAVFSDTDNRVAFGFSKGASPNNATSDWCSYQVTYGSDFPDYPKLGDSRFFSIIGVNVFTGVSFSGSDIMAIGKPPAGTLTACPDPSSFEFGTESDLMVGAVTHFTPVPANEIDANGTGWVLTRPSALPATHLGLFKVTRNATSGDPVIQNPGTSLTVPSFTFPANAPQKDGSFLLDTSDARLTQAVAANDPARGGKLHVWTQHAVAGGAGSAERWYEINPAAPAVAQTTKVTHSSLYIFNGAISPDRKVNGTTKAFGSNMVLSYNTSSSSTYPAIRMVGKRGASGVSAPVLVKSSPGHDVDFACPSNGFCRWGDYAAATPDPAASASSSRGVIWLTSMWTADGDTTGGTSGTSWRTFNWSARP